jgi:hypothetical protein
MDPDQTARMRRLVWIHAGRKRITLVLSWHGSFMLLQVEGLEERLSSARNQIEQLSHTLSDKDAQLNIESNNCKVCLPYIFYFNATHL